MCVCVFIYVFEYICICISICKGTFSWCAMPMIWVRVLALDSRTPLLSHLCLETPPKSRATDSLSFQHAPEHDISRAHTCQSSVRKYKSYKLYKLYTNNNAKIIVTKNKETQIRNRKIFIFENNLTSRNFFLIQKNSWVSGNNFLSFLILTNMCVCKENIVFFWIMLSLLIQFS